MKGFSKFGASLAALLIAVSTGFAFAAPANAHDHWRRDHYRYHHWNNGWHSGYYSAYGPGPYGYYGRTGYGYYPYGRRLSLREKLWGEGL